MGYARDKCLYQLFLLSLQKKGKIKKIFSKQGIERIAIYGMGLVGTSFYKLCLCNNIDVIYGIDVNEKIIDGLQVLAAEESILIDADAIIITPLYDNKTIINELNRASEARIILIGDLLNELLIALNVKDSY